MHDRRHSNRQRALAAQVLEATPVAVAVLDRQGRITLANRRAEELLGRMRDDAAGQANARCRLTDAEGNPLRDDPLSFRPVVESGEAIHGRTLAFVRDDGRRVLVSVDAAPLFDADGRVEGVVATLVDVTHQRQAEESLRATQRRYRQLLGAVTTYTYTVHLENGAPASTEHGPACVTATGYTADEYAADPNLWITMVHPEDRQPVREHVAEVLSGKPVPPLEHRIFHKDGSVRWIRDTIVQHFDESGRLTHYDGLVEDITERKRIDARFQRLFEATPDAMILTDERGKIVLANAQSEKTFGYRREELEGQSVEILVPKRYRDRHPVYRDEYSTRPRARPMGLHPELWAIRKDGTEFPAEISLSPLQTEEGLLVLSAIRDVTERKRTEKALRDNQMQMLAAQKIQEYLLPREPPRLPGYDVAGASLPAEFTAGDYFDYIGMPNQSLGLVIGDVSGHGFGPALLMASTQALLRSLAQTHTDVSPILEGANRFLVDETDVDRFVTLLYVRLDLPTRSIVYANAGHPTAYVLDREGAVKHRLESLSLPLAIDGGAEFPCRGPLPLEPGDVLLMTTDGVLEARSPDESFFGIERMLDVVVANRARPAREIIESLFGAVRLFSGTAKLTDDVTAVAVKVGD